MKTRCDVGWSGGEQIVLTFHQSAHFICSYGKLGLSSATFQTPSLQENFHLGEFCTLCEAVALFSGRTQTRWLSHVGSLVCTPTVPGTRAGKAMTSLNSAAAIKPPEGQCEK